MRVLIVADVYPPEISSAGHLMKELAQGLTQKKHQVTVVTSYPRHYLSSESENQNIKEVSMEDNVKVVRVKTLPLRKVNFLLRGISQLILPFLFFNKTKKAIKENQDIAIVYSPPLLLGLMSPWIKKRYHSKIILNVQDIFPQNAIDLGILKNKTMISFFEKIERKVYRNADLITFNSQGGRNFLVEKKNLPPEKVIVLHNWIDPEPYLNLNQESCFLEQYQLKNKFVFLFAGVMGPAQGLSFLIEVAKQVSDIKDLVFLLVGDGMEKEKLEEEIKKNSLTNIIIKPFVPKEKYPYLLKEIDVGIVCLSVKNKTPFLPGKFLGYLVAQKPIIAFLNKESDGFSLIEKAGCGYAVTSDDPEKAAKKVREMYRNDIKAMGKKGQEYLLNNFTLNASVEKLEKIFKELY
jgi:colanic acid biosynthesis glycosyl transferase WcaI